MDICYITTDIPLVIGDHYVYALKGIWKRNGQFLATAYIPASNKGITIQLEHMLIW